MKDIGIGVETCSLGGDLQPYKAEQPPLHDNLVCVNRESSTWLTVDMEYKQDRCNQLVRY